MHKVCLRTAVRDPAPLRRGSLRRHSLRPRPPGAKPSFAAKSGGGGKEREARRTPASRAAPFHPRTPGKGKGGDFLVGHRIRRLCAFSFPHVSPSPH